MISEADFHIVKANQALTVELEGRIKTSPPAAVSRSTTMIDWWDIIYPKGLFNTIDFGDIALDVGRLDYNSLRIYFIFEQGETDKTGAVSLAMIMFGPEELFPTPLRLL